MTDLTATDHHYMAMALRLAEKGVYTTHPNPCVGCVIVKDNVVVGSGYHARAGEGHAEVNALKQAGEAAQGATAYVTLEPCAHQGRTGPCAVALTEAGIRRVVVAMLDPYPKVAGEGIKILQNHQVQVDCPIMESSARALNPGFLSSFERQRPYTRLKLAMSLDGKTALANGESKWITGPEARQDVQRLRARSAAIVTGVQTVIDDDPSLRIRAEELNEADADLIAAIPRRRVVLDSTLRMPHEGNILGPDLTVITGVTPPENLPFDAVQLALQDNRISLAALMQWLKDEDLHEVLFECGGTLAGSLLAEGWVDELIVYMAPRLMGGDGRSLLGMEGITRMADVHQLDISSVIRVGDDIKITAVPRLKAVY